MVGNMSSSVIIKILENGYDKALNGLPGFITAAELANKYNSDSEPLDKQAKKLITGQISMASTYGFITGLGGIFTMPVSLPANIASLLYVQIRLVAAIACLCNHDINNSNVKTKVFLCLCGNEVNDLLRDFEIRTGTTLDYLDNIFDVSLNTINQAVALHILKKFGQTGVVTFLNVVPVLGGVINGTFDAMLTKTIGTIAIRTFKPCTEVRPNLSKVRTLDPGTSPPEPD